MIVLKKSKEIFINLSIYIVSFFIVYLLKQGTLYLTEIYTKYFIIFLFCWLLSSILSGKFIRNKGSDFWLDSRTYVISFILFLGLSSFSIQYFNMNDISRALILSSLLLPFIIELLFVRLIKSEKSNGLNSLEIKINLPVFVRELAFLSFSIAFIIFLKKDELKLAEINLLLIFGIYLNWIVASIFAGNLTKLHFQSNKLRYFWNYIKSYIVLFILSAFLLLFVRIDVNTQLYFLYSVLFYTLISIVNILIVLIAKIPVKSDEVKLKIMKATAYEEYLGEGKRLNKNGKYNIHSERGLSPILSQKMSSTYLVKFPKLLSFINKNVNLELINDLKAVILKSSDPYNIEVLPENYIEFYLNLHEINDVRRINNYFIEINKKLVDGGIYISRLEPTYLRYKRFMSGYPFYLAQFFYFIDFLLKRVAPKLPYIKKIYFMLTNGRNRVFSLAEGLGRLYYCGFEIIDIHEIDNFVYFIAKKIKNPSIDKNPSYGPFFKMKRIGKNGKTINVYKLRTMHPYSEYIQQFTFELMGTKNGDKIINDFRITIWGKYLRKFWIDELPMLINLFKGQLKLVGVRPLSFHKYSTYPDDLKKERIKYKPGLVPPYYADMPKNVEDFFETERKYLDEYKKYPLKTDTKYFFKAFYNIIFKKARSG